MRVWKKDRKRYEIRGVKTKGRMEEKRGNQDGCERKEEQGEKGAGLEGVLRV